MKLLCPVQLCNEGNRVKAGDIHWRKNVRVRWFIGVVLVLGLIVLAVEKMLEKPPGAKSGPIAITARQLVLDSSAPERIQLGALHFLGAWQLTAPDRSFGGLSSLHVKPDGRLEALNDDGAAFIFPQPGMPGPGMVKVLPVFPGRKSWTPFPHDSESQATDTASGKIWVGYELLQRICRFSPAFAQVERCRVWPEMMRWPITGSIESMVRLPDGRFLFLSENAVTNEGAGKAEGRETLLFAGDPAAMETPHPIRMTYIPPAGYDPTDALWIGGSRLLVLNRRATVYDGFTAIITLVDVAGMGKGAVLRGREVARLAPPVLADNFEGLALERKDGQRILWIVSDDNFLFFQRTLLLKFALPENL
jgi:hypothetical protein